VRNDTFQMVGFILGQADFSLVQQFRDTRHQPNYLSELT
jgi:hypothetical protein